jgi:hypothetical protein
MAWSDIFLPRGAQTYDEAQINFARLQSRLAEQTAAKQKAGTISDEDLALNRSLIKSSLENQNAAAAAGFMEGLQEGRQNIKTGIGNFISEVLGTIPWQLWLLAGVALFLWLGGMTWLRGRLPK